MVFVRHMAGLKSLLIFATVTNHWMLQGILVLKRKTLIHNSHYEDKEKRLPLVYSFTLNLFANVCVSVCVIRYGEI